MMLCFLESQAQTEEPTNALQKYRPKLALKWTPTAIFNYTPGIQVGLEFATKEDQSVHFELAYLVHLAATNQNYRGYRAIAEYRFYQFRKKKNIRHNSYLGGQIHFKQTFLSGKGTFARANFSYNEIIDYNITNSTQNLLFVIGHIFPINDKWFFDLSLSGGVRALSVRYKNIPNDARLISNDNDFFNVIRSDEGRYLFPKTSMNMRLIYVMK